MPRANSFSNAEMASMIAVYCQEDFNGGSAARRYRELYPNRRQPNRKLFQILFQRLSEHGSIKLKPHVGRPSARTADEEEDILDRIAEDPEVSVRRLSAATGVPRTSTHKIIRAQLLYPYHYNKVQELLPQDPPQRVLFCRWLQNKQRADPTFFGSILFTDEANFTRRGVTNMRNSKFWSEANPHLNKTKRYQHEFSVNVWCGIVGDHMLGPYELPHRLNGNAYLNFLQNELPILMEDLPLDLRRRIWFMHDGAPSHYDRHVQDHLNNVFPGQWIGRGSNHPWPPRSPDLNPLDFSIWGQMKQLVYHHQSNTRAQLLVRIREAAEHIRNNPDLFFRIKQNFGKRCRKCIEVDGEHFENLL